MSDRYTVECSGDGYSEELDGGVDVRGRSVKEQKRRYRTEGTECRAYESYPSVQRKSTAEQDGKSEQET